MCSARNTALTSKEHIIYIRSQYKTCDETPLPSLGHCLAKAKAMATDMAIAMASATAMVAALAVG